METRGVLGGICLAIGGLPLVLFYGLESFGVLGVLLIAIGALVSYGAYNADSY